MKGLLYQTLSFCIFFLLVIDCWLSGVSFGCWFWCICLYRTNGVIILSTTVQLHATHGKGGRRRKRHSTSTCEWGQQLFRLRLLRVTGRARRVALIKPPPPHPRTPHGQNMWFSGFSAKSEDGLYLEAQKCCSWIRTAFLIMYEFEWQW
jgi:hypothetical protein